MHCSKGVGKECCRSAAQVRMTLTEDHLKHLIRRFDINGDGRLSNQELKEAFRSLGSRFPAWRAWRVLHYADANGDGYISEEELSGLVNYLVKHGYAKK